MPFNMFALIILALTNIILGLTNIIHSRRLKVIETRLDLNSRAWGSVMTNGIHNHTPNEYQDLKGKARHLVASNDEWAAMVARGMQTHARNNG
jgi:hypothetical protein